MDSRQVDTACGKPDLPGSLIYPHNITDDKAALRERERGAAIAKEPPQLAPPGTLGNPERGEAVREVMPLSQGIGNEGVCTFVHPGTPHPIGKDFIDNKARKPARNKFKGISLGIGAPSRRRKPVLRR